MPRNAAQPHPGRNGIGGPRTAEEPPQGLFPDGLTSNRPRKDPWEVAAKMEIERLNRKAFYWNGLGLAYCDVGQFEAPPY